MKLKLTTIFTIIFLAVLYSQTGFSWSNHSLATAIAIEKLPESKDQVKVETLESFLIDARQDLSNLLETEETFAKRNFKNYPERPAHLAFQNPKNSQNPEIKSELLKKKFIQAIRINPNSKLELFLKQKISSNNGSVQKSQILSPEKISLVPKSSSTAEHMFLKINENDLVSASAVFATASDEPDYGLDLNLWADNGSEFGKLYGFGIQPFGNPKLEFSSQIPFHIGYFHESKLLYLAASFLSRTLPEYRVHLFLTLAKYAFNKGHPYWGYRFLGWGVHYIQDLTQPYHSTVMPGASTAYLLWVNFLDKIGQHGPKLNLIQEVSNQHLTLESFSYNTLKDLEQTNDPHHPLLKALNNIENDTNHPDYSESYIRDIISKESYEMAHLTNNRLKIFMENQTQPQQEMIALNIRLLTAFAVHTRKFFQAGRSINRK